MTNLMNAKPKSEEEIKAMKAEALKAVKEGIMPDEAVKIAYVPLILMKIVKQYMDAVTRICVNNRLNYRREVNELRELWRTYERRIPIIPGTTGKTLDEITNVFIDKSNSNMNILWFSVNNELLREYPNLPQVQNELLSYIYCLTSILGFTLRYQDETGKKVEKILKVPYMKFEKDVMRKIQKVCDRMSFQYPINTDDMVTTATKVIENKVASIILEVAKCKE